MHQKIKSFIFLVDIMYKINLIQCRNATASFDIRKTKNENITNFLTIHHIKAYCTFYISSVPKCSIRNISMSNELLQLGINQTVSEIPIFESTC